MRCSLPPHLLTSYLLTTSPLHLLTTSPPHHLTSPPHHLTTSPPHHLTTSPPLTSSPPHHLTPHLLASRRPAGTSLHSRMSAYQASLWSLCKLRCCPRFRSGLPTSCLLHLRRRLRNLRGLLACLLHLRRSPRQHLTRRVPAGVVPAWHRVPAWLVPAWLVPAWLVPAWLVPAWLVPAWLVPAWQSSTRSRRRSLGCEAYRSVGC